MYKQKLQELCQKNKWDLPLYSTTKCGLDHSPSFKCSVSVNGFSTSSSSTFSSSRHSQNDAAHIAFLHFTQEPVTNANDEMQPGWKKQLESYTRWKNTDAPIYSSMVEGPSHAPLYRASVVMEGHAFETSQSFGTSDEAENACAEMALSYIAADDFEEGNHIFFYKNLLMELAQKEDISKPLYETINIGPPHVPTFYSFVEFYGEKFYGKAAKCKKAAESKAAKVAFAYLEANGMTAKDVSTYYEYALTEIQSGICSCDITNEDDPTTNNDWVSVEPETL